MRRALRHLRQAGRSMGGAVGGWVDGWGRRWRWRAAHQERAAPPPAQPWPPAAGPRRPHGGAARAMSSLRLDPSCLKEGSFRAPTNACVSGVMWLAEPTTTSPGAARFVGAADRRAGSAAPGRCTYAPCPLAAQ